MSLPFCPSAGAARPFPRSAEREIPARKRRIANATRVHHVKGAEEKAAARQRRIANATRVHHIKGAEEKASEEWAAAQPRRVLTRLVCPGGRLLRKTCLPAATIGFSRCKQLFLTVHGSHVLFCDSSRALYPIIFAGITKFLHFSQIFLTYIVI